MAKNIEDLPFGVQALLDGDIRCMGHIWLTFSHHCHTQTMTVEERTTCEATIKKEGNEEKKSDQLFYMGHSMMCLQSFLLSGMHIYNTRYNNARTNIAYRERGREKESGKARKEMESSAQRMCPTIK